MLQAEENLIPKTYAEMKKRPPVTWFNEECEREEKIVKIKYKNTEKSQKNKIN